jgi:hypothetical protein
MNLVSTEQYIKAENISLRALKFAFFDTQNQTCVSFTLPYKTIYNELGYWIKHKHQIRELRDTSFVDAMSILLLVSIKDRKIQGDEALEIEASLECYQALSHLHWIVLELFKAVARMASRIGLNTPEIIKNEQKAWKDYFIRAISSKERVSSKRQYIRHIRNTAKTIRRGENPFNTESPELKIFIDYALLLSDVNQSDQNWPNNIRTLRKHIRQRLKDLNQALTGYATYLERNPCKVIPEIDGRLWERGIKGHMRLIK